VVNRKPGTIMIASASKNRWKREKTRADRVEQKDNLAAESARWKTAYVEICKGQHVLFLQQRNRTDIWAGRVDCQMGTEPLMKIINYCNEGSGPIRPQFESLTRSADEYLKAVMGSADVIWASSDNGFVCTVRDCGRSAWQELMVGYTRAASCWADIS
jgi:hypothetical protein